jgi:hypothetical protein
VIQEATDDNDHAFMEKMVRYTRSMNGVPVDRVSIHAKDLLRLIEMVNNSQQSLFTTRQDFVPPFEKKKNFHD